MLGNRDVLEWFQLYSDVIYQFLIYRTGSADVEDLVQEVFIKAMKGIERYEGNASPKTWLFSIARNVAIDEIRRRKRYRIKNLLFESQHTRETINNPEEILLLNEENKYIFRVIQSLKAAYRDVLIMRGIQQLSVAEAAAALEWNENKVRSTYHRARKALKQRLGGISDE
ncbi:RNA polymerase sigma factor [Peribacillus glennii]|uniref:RNA polymerase sigma factor n=1 Tax=Peribacillus glennii TaxID=2303991 RepID=UPI0026BC1C0F|nr:RNA polymerase sigma factor [Peribacillus glennii]